MVTPFSIQDSSLFLQQFLKVFLLYYFIFIRKYDIKYSLQGLVNLALIIYFLVCIVSLTCQFNFLIKNIMCSLNFHW